MRTTNYLFILILTTTLLGRAGGGLGQDKQVSEFDIDLANQGVAFLKKYCTKCHHVEKQFEDLDVLDRRVLLKSRGQEELSHVVPGDAQRSNLWEQVATGQMPKGKNQPTEKEKVVLKKWINAGAHFPPVMRPKRAFVGELTLMRAIESDLESLGSEDAKYTRYFSLFHLSNKTEGDFPISNGEIRLTRAAVSKLINSLSNKSRIRTPRVVDQSGTLLAIDLRHYGWGQWHWDRLLSLYPYGLRISDKSASRVYRLTRTKIPHIRADWFVFNASRPPLYHDLLGIPRNAKSLETRLGINIFERFQKGDLMRAAFEISGVSDQNRMIERIDPLGGEGGRYYYKSYDMKPTTEADGDFTRRPLGPRFSQSKTKQIAAFKHDGGEIIFALKNGLQGYMLVDGEDARIDQGPDDVVSDDAFHSGSFRIVNGISCFGCHRKGMIPWKSDEIRPLFEGKEGQIVADKVLQLYPKNIQMQNTLLADQNHYLAALEEAIGKFVRVGKSDNRKISEFLEPVTTVSKRYQNDLTVFDAARELGLAENEETAKARKTKSVQDLLAHSRLLRESGLAPFLRDGGTVRRAVWEKQMQRIARELELGTPCKEER